jgi:DNA-binding MarR family transcriptional regulator
MKMREAPVWDPTSVPTFWINHSSRLIMRRFEQVLRPLGFGMAYLPVAMTLDRAGALVQRELVERAYVEQPTVAALLTRMERDGLIARAPHPDDGRASLISLTAKAKARLPKARGRLFEVVEQALKGFSKQERATLIGLLQRVVANLAEDHDAPP